MDKVMVAVYKSKLLTLAERKVDAREADLHDAVSQLNPKEFREYMART